MLTFIECEVDSCCFGFCAVTLMMFLGLYVNLITFAWWLWSSDLFIVLCCLIWTDCDWIIVPLGVLFGQTMRKHIYELVVCWWWFWGLLLLNLFCYGWTDSWFLYFKSLLKEWFEFECYFESLFGYDLKRW